MRTFLALAATAALSNAAVTIIEETTKECWFGEGADYLGECFDLYYWYCEHYNIWADQSCVIRTFSDSLVKTESDFVDVAYWQFAQRSGWLSDIEESTAAAEEDQFDDFNFKADVSFTEQAATRLQDDLETTDDVSSTRRTVVVNEIPDDWVDPFENCEELNTRPITYDLDSPPKLNYVWGMCGFKIQFTNTHEYAPAMV